MNRNPWNQHCKNPETYSGSNAKNQYNEIKKHIKGKILEIGTGAGQLAEEITKEKVNYTGIDNSKQSVEKIKTKYNIKHQNIFKIEENTKYNTIIAMDVIEHFPPKKTNVFFKKINKILAADGKIIISTPNQENLKDQLCICPDCGKNFHKWGHKQVFNQSRIEKIFREHNLKTIQIQEIDFFKTGKQKVFDNLKKIIGIKHKKKSILAIAKKHGC